MNKKQVGFTGIEGIIVVLVTVIVAAVGWLAYSRYQQRTTSPLPTGNVTALANARSYYFPGGYFSLLYPSNWSLSASSSLAANDVAGGVINTKPVVRITPPNAPNIGIDGQKSADYVEATLYKSSNATAIMNQFEGGTAVKNRTDLIIDGNKALFQQNEPINNKNQSSYPANYTDDIYAVTHNNTTVVFWFGVKEGSQAATMGLPPLTGFNASNLLPDFNAIVTSIKF